MSWTSFCDQDLRAAIAARWGNRDPDWVITTHGGSEAIYVALSTLLQPGDRLASDLDELSTVATTVTRAIVVNFPHNPTGVTLTRAEQLRLIEIAESAGAYLLWDGALTDLVYAGEPLPDPTRIYDRAISIGAFFKAFGLPGMRFGWCCAHPAVIAGMIRLRDRVTLSLSPLLELLSLHRPQAG